MRRGLALALLVTLPALGAAPTAAACSWITPEPFDVVRWATPNALAVTRAWEAGRFVLPDGTYEREANVAFDRELALSPDGRWFAYANGTWRASRGVHDGGIVVSDSCDVGHGSVVAKDAETGDVVLVDDEGATALAASRERLALAAGSTVRLLEWGTFVERARVDVDVEGDTWLDTVYGLVFSRDGRLLVAWGGRTVAVHDADDGRLVARLLAPEGAHVHEAALSPDGAKVAYAAGDGEAARVAVHALADGSRVAEATFPGRVGGVAWGPAGLAVALVETGEERADGGRDAESRAVLLDDALAVVRRSAALPTWYAALDWSPDGERLAFGGGGRLLVLDAALATLAEHRLSGDEGMGGRNDPVTRRAPAAGEGAPPPPGSGAWSVPAAGGAAAVVALLGAGLAALAARGARR